MRNDNNLNNQLGQLASELAYGTLRIDLAKKLPNSPPKSWNTSKMGQKWNWVGFWAALYFYPKLKAASLIPGVKRKRWSRVNLKGTGGPNDRVQPQ